jgi:hypothetical protein
MGRKGQWIHHFNEGVGAVFVPKHMGNFRLQLEDLR